MRSVACIGFTQKGCELARRFADRLCDDGLAATVSGPERFSSKLGIEPTRNLSAWTDAHFERDDALVFVGAAGIAVRAIAPHVADKFHDPAVVVVDEEGSFAMPLLSGHVGGANDLARRLAQMSGGEPVISTATDVNGVFAVDEFARKQGFAICERSLAKRASSALLAGESIGFASDFPVKGPLPHGLEPAGEGDSRVQLGIHVTLDENSCPFNETLHLVPAHIIVGAGCRKGVEPERFEKWVAHALAGQNISSRAVKTLASIDVKAHERALLDYAEKHDCTLCFFSAEELQAQKGEFSRSQFVADTVGVDNVCERAAMRASDEGELICGKQAHDGVTVALVAEPVQVCFEDTAFACHPERAKRAEGSPPSQESHRKLSVVGLGPGGADSMTLQARACIEDADLIVGYSVYVDLVKATFPNKETLATPMRKEVDRCCIALEQAAGGRHVALVCSGDPGVYGMAGLVLELAADYPDVAVEIVPGVSAANGGAAVLGAALMHDYAVISLSDLLTPWSAIERRLHMAARGDFVICLYNPSSRKRAGYLKRACDILLEDRAPNTVCGYVRNICREGEEAHITTLGELRETSVDMFTTVFIGNSQTKVVDGRMVTPRGYCILDAGELDEDVRAKEPPARFLIFGGTSEGRELAIWLSARESCEVHVCCATGYGGSLVEELPHVHSHTGRLSGSQIRELIADGSFTCVIDATHPYASSISASVKDACAACGTPLERVVREEEPHGDWTSFPDAQAAAQYVSARAGNVLLTTGSKDLHTFTGEIADFANRLYARVLPVDESIARVRELGIPPSHIIAMQGPFSTELNCALIREYNIGILVTKASGSAGGFEEKVAAADACGAELVVINRPCAETGLRLDEVKERLKTRYGA